MALKFVFLQAAYQSGQVFVFEKVFCYEAWAGLNVLRVLVTEITTSVCTKRLHETGYLFCPGTRSAPRKERPCSLPSPLKPLHCKQLCVLSELACRQLGKWSWNNCWIPQLLGRHSVFALHLTFPRKSATRSVWNWIPALLSG